METEERPFRHSYCSLTLGVSWLFSNKFASTLPIEKSPLQQIFAHDV